ncbi:MAG: hypothetical protein GY793_04600 [Proteobacteria bacterium]|nr:hypothetical protein [Pseudomonadota bacterium]
MSKTLKTLLKLSQKKLDDQTNVLAELNTRRQGFLAEKERLNKAIITEINSSGDDILSFNLAHNFAHKAKAGIIYIDDQVAKLQEIIEQEREVMKHIFLQKKKQEIMLENYIKRKKAEYNKKVNAQLDDFNSIAFINKSK